MKRGTSGVFRALLLLPALLLFAVSLAVLGLVLSMVPPIVGAVAGWLLAIAALWFFLVRRRGPGPVSEAGFIGQRSSKDGLL